MDRGGCDSDVDDIKAGLHGTVRCMCRLGWPEPYMYGVYDLKYLVISLPKLQWLQWLQWGVTFSQVVWLIG